MAINVAIVGCGLIGKKRAAQIKKDPSARLLYAVDIHEEPRTFFQSNYGCNVLSNWEELIQVKEVDVIIISTPNHLSMPIAKEALRAKKHILLEKPFGKNGEESRSILESAHQAETFLAIKAGFNHRFHPALLQAKSLVEKGIIGDLFSIRARYGHGGRPGMEQEWRANKELCGGGELLDQGIHLIDLIQWFGGEWKEVCGLLDTSFWPMQVEDNAYVIGKMASGIHTMFHVSWTQWKNLFSFELFGSKGALHVHGLGGSYGPETLEIILKNPQGGAPKTTTLSFPEEDISWNLEWNEFKQALLEERQPLGNGADGLAANLVVEAIIRSQIEKKMVSVYE
ncbi:MAG: Gfo/Idh/MocA family oxidoreductase [Chlamydiales bacterium]|nr:Gfo/Idh/MocA family oxidoreductase [Chlamydiales bacterium]